MATRKSKNPWENDLTVYTVHPKKYAHGFCFAVLCCGYILTDFPISIRLTSLALWQSNDCPSASKATLMNMDKYFMWIHYERLHNHNKAKHNKTVFIFLGLYCNITNMQGDVNRNICRIEKSCKYEFHHIDIENVNLYCLTCIWYPFNVANDNRHDDVIICERAVWKI